MKELILSFWPVRWFIVRILPIWHWRKIDCLTPAEIERVGSWLRKGDIMLSFDKSKIAAILIGGNWTHAGLYVGDGYVVEAVQPKLRLCTVYEFCSTSEGVGVLRSSAQDINERCAAAQGLVGLPYDALFKNGDEAFYCSEVIVALFRGIIKFTKHVVTPDDLWNHDKLKRVFHI